MGDTEKTYDIKPCVGGLDITADSGELEFGTDYTYENGVLTIKTPKAVTIKNTEGVTTTTDTIVVASGISANITLDGVNIDVSATYYACAFKIEDNSTGNVTITLASSSANVLKSGINCAGLQKNGNDSGIGKLTITGTGSLTATGGESGAGIGGGYEGSGSNITISGGTVSATGGKKSAGIGGGYNGIGSDITVSGGIVTAAGGEYGAGIGGGSYCSGSNITISGGTVSATGGYYGAGIGGGSYRSGSNITINGGVVSATGGKSSAGIGGSYEGSGSDITISGGTVTATGGESGAGIGGGVGGNGSYITINNGTVTATGGNSGAGIGGGYYSSGANITVNGGAVTASGGTYGAGIGGGINGNGSDITISGGSVKAVAGEDANAIGGGLGYDAVSPVNADGKSVYLLKIANPDSKDVYIDGVNYTPINHKAIDSTDTKLYAYLTAGKHTIKVGDSEKPYNVNPYVGDLDISADSGELDFETDYTYEDGALTINTSKAVTIKNAEDVPTTTDTIVVASGISANITLDGVNIDVSETNDACAFMIEDNSTGNVTIALANGSTNVLKSGMYCAGLQKNGNGSGIGKLTITGTGSLTATGGYCGAGIGGGHSGIGSDITVSGGTVTATGGNSGAGIGGGFLSEGSNIIISGGTVTAVSTEGGAGIGGGYNGSGSDITISGGTVSAAGGKYGAGIGGGSSGNGSSITVSGGYVTATGGNSGAGIGGGSNGGNGSSITISNGTVIANSGADAAGIGGGSNGKGSDISINGGTVTAASTKGGAGIGGGVSGNGSDITINNGTVTATGGYCGAGIGGGNNADEEGVCGSNITINGGTVTATGGNSGAGIGGGFNGNGSSIIINGGSVKAIAGEDANAIGGGYLCDPAAPVNTNSQKVYLLEIANPDSKDVYIDGVKYTPVNHKAIDSTDTRLYAYLTAGKHTVKVGDTETIHIYDEENNTWLLGVAIPDEDTTTYVYNGKIQTYNLSDCDYYTVSNNTQTNAGNHDVIISLKSGYAWSDGTMDDITYHFIIAQAEPEITVTAVPTKTYEGAAVTVTAFAVNPENTLLSDLPEISLTYKIGENGVEVPFEDTFTVPEDTAVDTLIIVTAYTEESDNYKAASKSETVTVIACEHNDLDTSAWVYNSTGHWHKCNDCSYKVDFEAHTEDEGTVITEATETTSGLMEYKCTECGYITRTEVIPALHSHIYSSAWSYDETGHWHECECGGKSEQANHTYNSGDKIANGKIRYTCSVCGYSFAVSVDMSVSDSPSYINPSYSSGIAYDKLNADYKISGNTLTLSWNKINNAGKYVIYEYKNGAYTIVKTTSGSSVSFDDYVSGNEYRYLIRYSVSGRMSPIGYSAYVTVSGSSKPVVTAAASTNAVRLTWDEVEGAEKYAVYRYADGKAKKLGETENTSVTIRGLSSETEYKFIVRAYLDGKWTTMKKSDIVTITTK